MDPNPSAGELVSINPADGSVIARVQMAGRDDYDHVAAHAATAFREWRMIPAPKRGEIVRQVADELRSIPCPRGEEVRGHHPRCGPAHQPRPKFFGMARPRQFNTGPAAFGWLAQ